MEGRRAATVDAILYLGSAAFAVAVAFLAGIPQYREWGRLSVGVYVAGGAAAWLLARRAPSLRARTWVAVGVFAGAALLPLALQVTWRASTGPGLHAQSEVLVTEEGAKALLDGRDPYGATFLHGSLAARPFATKTHFPYMPGMLTFGLPRAADGRSGVTDARVAFTAISLLLFLLACRRPEPGPPGRWLRAGQVLLALPTGALLMATGGDDLPVLALMLLSLILLDEGSAGWSGLAAGAAAALKQTAWPLLFFLALASPRARRQSFLAAAGAVSIAVIVPFVAWGPGAFVEDAIRFPLGLGQRSAAGTPTLGSVAVRALPGGRPLVVMLIVAVIVALAVFLARASGPSVANAARNAAVLLLTALVLAPAARIGYVIYPLNLLVWTHLLRARAQGRERAAEAPPALAIPPT